METSGWGLSSTWINLLFTEGVSSHRHKKELYSHIKEECCLYECSLFPSPSWSRGSEVEDLRLGPVSGGLWEQEAGWEVGKCSSDFGHLRSSALFSSHSDPLCPLSSSLPWFFSFSPPCYSFLFLLFLFHFPHYFLLSSHSTYSLEIQFWYLFIKGSIFASLATYHHMKQLFLRAKKKKISSKQGAWNWNLKGILKQCVALG